MHAGRIGLRFWRRADHRMHAFWGPADVPDNHMPPCSLERPMCWLGAQHQHTLLQLSPGMCAAGARWTRWSTVGAPLPLSGANVHISV